MSAASSWRCAGSSICSERERRYRRLEVQGGQCARQELHRGQDEAAPGADRREHRPLSLAARDRRSPRRGGPDAKVARLKDKLAKLKEEIARLNAINGELQASEDKQVSLTDPDARSMATSGKDTGIVGYNVQAAVDTEHHLIVVTR